MIDNNSWLVIKFTNHYWRNNITIYNNCDDFTRFICDNLDDWLLLRCVDNYNIAILIISRNEDCGLNISWAWHHNNIGLGCDIFTFRNFGDQYCWFGCYIRLKYLNCAINNECSDITIFVDDSLNSCNNILLGSYLLVFLSIYFNVDRLSGNNNFNNGLF